LNDSGSVTEWGLGVEHGVGCGRCPRNESARSVHGEPFDLVEDGPARVVSTSMVG